MLLSSFVATWYSYNEHFPAILGWWSVRDTMFLIEVVKCMVEAEGKNEEEEQEGKKG